MALCKRIIPCLDVDSYGRTVKGIQFQGLRDIGDPIELAIEYQRQGADELVFLDISASHEGRKTMVELVSKVAAALSIPFTVGGGISTLEQVNTLLAEGADKVSVNSSAVRRPGLLSEIAQAHGNQCCVLAIDAKRSNGQADRWDVLVKGGRERVEGLDAISWAQQAVQLGAGEILLTSWDRDGTGEGFDNLLTQAVSSSVSVPVIASGGANGPSSFIDVFTTGQADAALAASIFHDGDWTVNRLKEALAEAAIPVRQLQTI